MAIIGYARVSTGEQADSLPPQVARLTAAGCARVITDIESGRNSDRDGLLEVMAAVRSGEATELLITRVDRLGRDAAYTDALLATGQERDGWQPVLFRHMKPIRSGLRPSTLPD